MPLLFNHNKEKNPESWFATFSDMVLYSRLNHGISMHDYCFMNSTHP